jgi:hypothetical protein
VLIAVVLSVLGAPVLAEAQPANKVYRIGVLSLNPQDASSQLIDAFTQGPPSSGRRDFSSSSI